MNIVHIIGNGFDLNHGLPTSYAHFYEYYFQLVPKEDEPEVVKDFRAKLRDKVINRRTELWADLEKTLGELTAEFKTVEEYETVYLDVYTHLMEYLNRVYQHSEVAKYDEPEKSFFRDLGAPWLYLINADKAKIERYIPKNEDTHVSIIIFNYTDTINRVSDIYAKAGQVIGQHQNSRIYFDGCNYIHHTLRGKDIVLGVDNMDQIANKSFRDDVRIQNYLIKPQTNIALGTLVDDSCKKTINEARIICIFGMSIGETDKTWWRMIGKKLVSDKNACVIYYPFVKEVSNELPIRYPQIRNYYIDLLMGMMELNAHDTKQRLFVNFCNLPGQANIFANPKRKNVNDNFDNVMAKFQKEGKIIKPNLNRTPFDLEITPPIIESPLFRSRIYQERIPTYNLQKYDKMPQNKAKK